MTWFQLVDAQLDEARQRTPPARGERRLAPNSAFFLNPSLPLEGAPRSEAASRGHLRLVKGSRVDAVPTAA